MFYYGKYYETMAAIYLINHSTSKLINEIINLDKIGALVAMLHRRCP
jgi:hypothetical protein